VSFSPFIPTYIFPSELQTYGLPSPSAQPDILNLIQLASTIIDEACGRLDGDGNGSLVFTTYTQRILMQTRNRNLALLPIKPIVPITADLVAELTAAASGSASGNWYLTGCLQANTLPSPWGPLSGIVGASGRYGYTRQDMSIAYPDLFAFINPLNLVTMFGGPAPWVPVDVTQTDYDPKTGEVWVPAGLQLQRYSEIIITYNSGYNPSCMPPGVKMACACLVKNAMAKGDGTTALTSMSLSRSGANFGFMPGSLIDPTVDGLLTPYKSVRAY
jgi:hypothetical protein